MQFKRGNIGLFFKGDPTLKLWMPFEENSGTTTRDLSGNGNNGTLNGGALFTPAKFDNGIYFDGSNDYVDCGNATTITNTFTVGVWALVKDTSIHSIVGTRTNNYSFDMKFMNGNLIHGDIGNGSNWITIGADATFNYQLNTWYHIVYVVTQTGYTIYANGTQIGSGTYSTATPVFSDSNHKIMIGCNGETEYMEYYNGLIDEVAVFSRALSSREISEYYKWATGTPKRLFVIPNQVPNFFPFFK